MTCTSCHLDLTSTTCILCAECSVPSVTLCMLCFHGQYETDKHNKMHDYYVMSSEIQLNDSLLGSTTLAVLLTLDSMRKFSIGSWSDVAQRSRLSSREMAEGLTLTMYNYWRRSNEGVSSSAATPCAVTTMPVDAAMNRIMTPRTTSASESSDFPGFMSNRADFDLEYDDSAELIVADLEFLDDEPPDEFNIKLGAIKALRERQLRRESVKVFAVNMGMTRVKDGLDNLRTLTSEEHDVRGKLRPIERFFDNVSEFSEFMQLCVTERRLKYAMSEMQSEVDPQSLVDTHGETGQSNTATETATMCKPRQLYSDPSKRHKFADGECNRVQDIHSLEGNRSHLLSSMSQCELDSTSKWGMSPVEYGILRDAMLKSMNEEGFSRGEVTISQSGALYLLNLVGFR